MSIPVPVLVAVADPELEARVVGAVDAPGSGLRVVRRCVDLADLLAAAAAGLGRAAVVSADLRRLDADAVGRLAAAGCAALGSAATTEQAERLRRLGVTHLLPVPATGDAVVPALRAALTAPAPGGAVGHGSLPPDPAEGDAPPAGPSGVDAPPRRGRVVAVWGPTGAPGRTTLAVSLAAELAELRSTALLVDADTYGGVVAPLLGLLDEAPGLVAACRAANVGGLDLPALAALAREVLPGLTVLTGAARADRWTELRPAALEAVLELARGLADTVVVDCGFCLELDEDAAYDPAAPRRNGAALSALAAADTVLAVGAADPLGLQRLVRGLSELRERVPDVAPRVVVNRVRRGPTGPGDPEAAIRAALARYAGVEDAVLVPEDRPACDAALAAGRALAEVAPASPARQALRRLAAELAGVRVSEPRGGRLRRLSRARAGDAGTVMADRTGERTPA